MTRGTSTRHTLLATSALAQEMSFNRIASFGTWLNNGDASDAESSAEIITATADGMTPISSDSPMGVIGFIDITDPARSS